MSVPLVLVIAGVVALIFGFLGWGGKAMEIQIPYWLERVRGIATIAGFIFLGLAIWLSPRGAANGVQGAVFATLPPTATTVPPTPTSTLTPSLTSTITGISTSTPLLTPLPQPLDEVFPQVDGGETFIDTNNDGDLTSEFVETPGCVHSGLYGLQITYQMTVSGNGSLGVQWDNAPAGHFDASGFSAVTFWVRGAFGHETFQIGLKDTSGNEVRIDSNKALFLSSNWMPATIPLSTFKGVNPALIENLYFFFDNLNGSGSLCIDDVAFIP